MQIQDSKGRRKVKNILLAPKSQIRIGAIVFAIGFITMSVLFGIILMRFNDILDAFVAISTDRELAMEASRSTKVALWVTYSALLLGFLFSTFYLALKVTHRYLGPMVAIRRQIHAMKEGQYAERVKLRQDDEFQDIADDLNALAERLQKIS